MQDVRLNRKQKRVLGAAIEEPDSDAFLAAQLVRQHSVDTVNDGHRRPMNDDGGQRALHCSDHLYVVGVVSDHPRRFAQHEVIDHDGLDSFVEPVLLPCLKMARFSQLSNQCLFP
ncbi:hypothetical protein JOF35_008806 [Streptomyces demainii]|uniref:Uncharacterized protein n=1 Tax=Streptomyces demainii TaxID=588122 RepID=A0ABT9L6Y4_9ACTN|nr:hypothetical protein [Streptomyces demainii]MDP9612943.1 hypothetical protein [Streptomyces demainii]MDP9616448.1 hypothetical protein [Streptomyces demainii]